MISEQTASGVMPLALILASKNLGVTAVGGTPVAELVSHSSMASMGTVISADESTPEGALAAHAAMLGHATSSADGIQSSHDQSLDAMVATVSEVVRKHISTAKNQVRPAVLEFAENVQKAMGEPRLPSSDFQIDIVELPAPMRNSGFEESISKFKGKPVLSPDRELNLGEKTLEEILQLMLTGSKEYDACVAEWFGSLQPGFFLNIWNNLFRDFKESQPFVVCKFEDLVNSQIDGTDAALAIYLLARKLFDEVPANTGMDLNQYQQTVAEYRESSGAALARSYDNYNASLTNDVIVFGIGAMRKVARVNGPVYRQWLENGGSNEVLLGMLVTDDAAYHSTALNEKKDRYLAAWASYEAYSRTAFKNNTFNKFREVCSIYFAQSLQGIGEDEKALIASNGGLIEKIQELFNQTLNGLGSEEISDVHECALKLICRSRFFYTDAEKILRGINEAAKANPDGDVRQHALIATIEYVGDYVASQVQLVS